MKDNSMVLVIWIIVELLVDLISKSPSGDGFLSLPQFSKRQYSCDVGNLIEGLQAISRICDNYLEGDE